MSIVEEDIRHRRPTKCIQEGDIAVFFIEGRKYIARIIEGNVKVGRITLLGKGLIGKPYGLQRIAGMEIIIVPPLPSDKMEGIRRGPQVILPDDAAFIIFHAGIVPGSRVIEIGSGSGSLTIALSSLVGEGGQVFSIDRNMENLKISQRNVSWAGLESRVQFIHWDARKPFPKDIDNTIGDREVDAVIFDIPDPWEAVDNIATRLKTGGVLFSYLPTINQVERLRNYMDGISFSKGYGFVDPHTFEVLKREMVVKQGAVRPDYSMLGHTGYLTFFRKVQRC